MNHIRAIETEYAGCRFRSRLEARWAVFFTLAGYHWEYEPEGFELPDGMRYLPDFRVRSGPPNGQRSVWYEVKPAGTKTDEKFAAFCEALRSSWAAEADPGDWMPSEHAILLAGDPLEYLRANEVCPRCGVLELDCSGVDWSQDDELVCSCSWCDMHTPCGGDHPEQQGWLCAVRPHKGMLLMRAPEYERAMHRIFGAAVAARSERFERTHTLARPFRAE